MPLPPPLLLIYSLAWGGVHLDRAAEGSRGFELPGWVESTLECSLWQARVVTEDMVLLNLEWSVFIPAFVYLVVSLTKVTSSEQFIVCNLFLNALLLVAV